MKKRVAFVCIHNSCRSIMAEGWARALGNDVIEAYSAGTESYPAPKPLAIQVMEEAKVPMDFASSKLLSDIPNSFDILITMGCGVECPYVPCSYREDWGIEDPSGGSKEDFEKTREIIKLKMIEFILKIKNGYYS